MGAQKKAIHFGAGNVGRGFIGPLLAESGYHVVFSDVNKEVISELNARDHYDVHILDKDDSTEPGKAKPKERRQSISSVSGVLSITGDILKEFADPHVQLVTTAVGPNVLEKIAPTIAKGLKARKEALGAEGKGKLNVIGCENMVGQTRQLERYVLAHLNEEEKAWVGANVGWANCSVDRIVPPPPSSTEPENPLDVGVEPFYEWVVDETGLISDPAIKPEVKGMKLVENLDAYIERKLFTLNCGHAITAYLGYLKGYHTVDEAIKDEEIRKVVKGALEEGGRALVRKHGFKEAEHAAYVDKILDRFANPNLKDDVVRVGRQPLRKLGKADRLVGPADMAKGYRYPIDDLAKGIAAALLYDDRPQEEDEESAEVGKLVRERGVKSAVMQVTEWKEESGEVGSVVKAYEELKGWRREKSKN